MNVSDLQTTVSSIVQQDPDAMFAYLFGSHTKGTAHPRSDVDVAVFFFVIGSGSEGDKAAVDKQIELGLRLERALGKPVDVVVLNRASIDMRQNVLVHGELLFCKDPEFLAQFKITQLREHQDFIMMAPIFRHYRRRRIEEGTFGGRGHNRTQTVGND